MAVDVDWLVERLLEDAAFFKGLDFTKLREHIRKLRASRATDSEQDGPNRITSEVEEIDDESLCAICRRITMEPGFELENEGDVLQLETSRTLFNKTKIDDTVFEGLRLVPSDSRYWRALTGHEMDYRKMSHDYFEILTHIAAAGEAGVKQVDLPDLTERHTRAIGLCVGSLTRDGIVVRWPWRKNANADTIVYHTRFADKVDAIKRSQGWTPQQEAEERAASVQPKKRSPGTSSFQTYPGQPTAQPTRQPSVVPTPRGTPGPGQVYQQPYLSPYSPHTPLRHLAPHPDAFSTSSEPQQHYYDENPPETAHWRTPQQPVSSWQPAYPPHYPTVPNAGDQFDSEGPRKRLRFDNNTHNPHDSGFAMAPQHQPQGSYGNSHYPTHHQATDTIMNATQPVASFQGPSPYTVAAADGYPPTRSTHAQGRSLDGVVEDGKERPLKRQRRNTAKAVASKETVVSDASYLNRSDAQLFAPDQQDRTYDQLYSDQALELRGAGAFIFHPSHHPDSTDASKGHPKNNFMLIIKSEALKSLTWFKDCSDEDKFISVAAPKPVKKVMVIPSLLTDRQDSLHLIIKAKRLKGYEWFANCSGEDKLLGGAETRFPGAIVINADRRVVDQPREPAVEEHEGAHAMSGNVTKPSTEATNFRADGRSMAWESTSTSIASPTQLVASGPELAQPRQQPSLAPPTTPTRLTVSADGPAAAPMGTAPSGITVGYAPPVSGASQIMARPDVDSSTRNAPASSPNVANVVRGLMETHAPHAGPASDVGAFQGAALETPARSIVVTEARDTGQMTFQRAAPPYSIPEKHVTDATNLTAYKSSEQTPQRKLQYRLAKQKDELIMDIMREALGVFPGDMDLWYPYATRIRQVDGNLPHRVSFTKAIDRLIAESRLKRSEFSFTPQDDMTVTRHVLFLPKYNETSPEVQACQQAIQRDYPQKYLPRDIRFDRDLDEDEVDKTRRTGGRRPRRRALPDGENAKASKAPQTRKRARSDSDDDEYSDSSDEPNEEQLSLQSTFRAQGYLHDPTTAPVGSISESKPNKRVRRSPSQPLSEPKGALGIGHSRSLQAVTATAEPAAHQGPADARHNIMPASVPLNRSLMQRSPVQDPSVPSSQILPPAAAFLHTGAQGSTLDKRAEDQDVAMSSENVPMTLTWEEDELTALASEEEAAREQMLEEEQQQKTILNGSSSYTPRVNPSAWILSSFERSKTKAKSGSGPKQCTTLTSPDQSFYPNIGTFSTDFSVHRNVRPKLTIDAGLQRSFEDTMPSNLADILKTRRRASKNYKGSAFDHAVHAVEAWEAANRESLTSNKSLMMPRFINHHEIQPQTQAQHSGSSAKFLSNDRTPPAVSQKASSPTAQQQTPQMPNNSDSRSPSIIILNDEDAEPAVTVEGPWGSSRKTQSPMNAVKSRKSQKLADSVPSSTLHSYQISARPITNTSQAIQDKGQTSAQKRKRDSTLQMNEGSESEADEASQRPAKELRTPEFTARLIVVVTAVETLVPLAGGGMSISTVRKLLSGFSGISLKSRWYTLKRNQSESLDWYKKVFREEYLKAYQNDEVPTINYDDLGSHDWESLIEWGLVKYHDQSTSRESGTREELTGIRLPSTREDFDKKYVLEVEDTASSYQAMDAVYNHTAKKSTRKDAYQAVGFLQSQGESSQRAEDSKSDIELTAAITLVRANIMTDLNNYDPSAASDRLSQVSEDQLLRGIADLKERGVIQTRNKLAGKETSISTGNPSTLDDDTRTYVLDPAFENMLNDKNTWSASSIREAAQYKLELDAAFGPSLDGVIERPQHPTDAQSMVLCTLTSMAHVAVRPDLLRMADMTDFKIKDVPMQVSANKELYKPGLGSPVAKVLPPPGPHLTLEDYEEWGAEAQAVGRDDTVEGKQKKCSIHDKRIPLWYDIHDNLMTDVWDKFACAVLQTIVTRAMPTVRDIVKAFKGKVEHWDVELVARWLERRGVVKLGDDGRVRPLEWWWCAFGSEDIGASDHGTGGRRTAS